MTNSHTRITSQDRNTTVTTKNSGSAIVGLVLLLLVIIGAVFLLVKTLHHIQAMQPAMDQSSPLPQTTPTPQPQEGITSVFTTAQLDSQGKPVQQVSLFSPTTKTIYLAVGLQNATIDTRVEYVRYLNNKYLDNNALQVTHPDANAVSFSWTLQKAGATHAVGTYRVKVYLNGAFAKETSFVVQ